MCACRRFRKLRRPPRWATRHLGASVLALIRANNLWAQGHRVTWRTRMRLHHYAWKHLSRLPRDEGLRRVGDVRLPACR